LISFPLAEMIAEVLELLPAPPITRDQVRLLKTDKINSGREPTLADLEARPADLRAFLSTFKAVQ
jgi:NADH dehydrogenase